MSEFEFVILPLKDDFSFRLGIVLGGRTRKEYNAYFSKYGFKAEAELLVVLRSAERYPFSDVKRYEKLKTLKTVTEIRLNRFINFRLYCVERQINGIRHIIIVDTLHKKSQSIPKNTFSGLQLKDKGVFTKID